MEKVDDRLQRLAELSKGQQADYFLLNSPASLRYFTGYSFPVETGPSPFYPVPALLLWVRDEQPTLFLTESESFEGVREELPRQAFAGYTFERPLDSVRDLLAKLSARFTRARRGVVGLEAEFLPAALLDGLRAAHPQLQFCDVSSALTALWVVKDAEEVGLIRRAVELCDIAQAAVKDWARPGLSEIEVFAAARKAMEAAAGCRVPVLADLVAGTRTAAVGGPPTGHRLETGQLVISDVVSRLNGYWGDTCNTCVVGEPSKEQSRVFQGISNALAEAIASVRPGMRACDLDAMLRERVAKLGGTYPHHSGHGLGLTYHEEPRIVPYNTMTLGPGMVIALEPGIYFPDRWGLRLEHCILVTETGAEVLSKFDHRL